MKIRLTILATLIITSCGSEVNISNKKLEYNSGLSNGVTITTNQEGVLVRAVGSKDKISLNAKSYVVSVYSSYLALEFIAAKKMDKSYPVKLKGKTKGDEIVLELLEDK